MPHRLAASGNAARQLRVAHDSAVTADCDVFSSRTPIGDLLSTSTRSQPTLTLVRVRTKETGRTQCATASPTASRKPRLADTPLGLPQLKTPLACSCMTPAPRAAWRVPFSPSGSQQASSGVAKAAHTLPAFEVHFGNRTKGTAGLLEPTLVGAVLNASPMPERMLEPYRAGIVHAQDSTQLFAPC